MRSIAAGFFGGLTSPSLASLVSSTVVVLACLAWCFTQITPDFVMEHRRRLASNAVDDDVFVTAEAFAFRRASHPKPTVVISGASSLRESIVVGDVIDREIADRTHQAFDLVNLTSSAQALPEVLELIETMGTDYRGVFVFDVGPSKFALGPADWQEIVNHPRLGMVAAGYDQQMKAAGVVVPRRLGNYFLDNRGFVLARWRSLVMSVWRGPVEHSPNRYGQLPPLSEDRWTGRADSAQQQISGYQEHGEANFAMLDQMIGQLRKAGVRVVMVVPPINPRFVRDWQMADVLERQRRQLTQTAERLDVKLLDLPAEVDFKEDQFYDWCHLRDAATQLRTTRLIAGAVAQELAKIEAPETQR